MNLASLQVIKPCRLVNNTYGELVLHEKSTLQDTKYQKITYMDQKEIMASITSNDDITWIGETRIEILNKRITPEPPRISALNPFNQYTMDDEFNQYTMDDDFYEDEFGQLRQI
jgi:hypothetical protein